MTTLTIVNCPGCQRDFAVEGKTGGREGACKNHCSLECCRRTSCPGARPPKRTPQGRSRTCIVCGRSNLRFPFEKFAPCDEGCVRMFNHTPGPYADGYPRGWHCLGVFSAEDDYMRASHSPKAAPRVHIKYCSLRCFYSERGHDARKRAGEQRRARRYWEKDGGNKNAYLRAMRESGQLPPRTRTPRTAEEWRDRYPLRPGRPPEEQG